MTASGPVRLPLPIPPDSSVGSTPERGGEESGRGRKSSDHQDPATAIHLSVHFEPVVAARLPDGAATRRWLEFSGLGPGPGYWFGPRIEWSQPLLDCNLEETRNMSRQKPWITGNRKKGLGRPWEFVALRGMEPRASPIQISMTEWR